jgi:hypothetical protein
MLGEFLSQIGRIWAVRWCPLSRTLPYSYNKISICPNFVVGCRTAASDSVRPTLLSVRLCPSDSIRPTLSTFVQLFPTLSDSVRHPLVESCYRPYQISVIVPHKAAGPGWSHAASELCVAGATALSTHIRPQVGPKTKKAKKDELEDCILRNFQVTLEVLLSYVSQPLTNALA